jgi:hypothetical protein
LVLPSACKSGCDVGGPKAVSPKLKAIKKKDNAEAQRALSFAEKREERREKKKEFRECAGSTEFTEKRGRRPKAAPTL